MEALAPPLLLNRPIAPVGDGPGNYVRPDMLVLDDVARAIADEPELDGLGLEVVCEDGVVRVRGRVSSTSARDRLEALVAGTLGVRDAHLESVVVRKDVTASDEGESPEDEDRGGRTAGSAGKRRKRSS